MRRAIVSACTAMTGLVCAGPVLAQFATFTNQTSTRLVADPSVGTADGQERDWAVGDFNHDGKTDLVVVRKIPYSLPGGRRGVLLMNENGVLTDRTLEKMSAADVVGSTGMLDNCNNRDVNAVDVNNDGWLDIVTAATISDGLPKYIGHPRVYINLGSVSGVWQGFRFENNRIPQLVTISGLTNQNPRFCGMASGDVTGDGYADLYFTDYDTGEVGPGEASANDFNNRLLINQGAANPGFFTDESTARMGSLTGSMLGGATGSFGIAAAIADFNGDGKKDIARILTLVAGAGFPLHAGLAYNNAAGTGTFTTQTYQQFYSGQQPYGLSVADLNHDGKMDVIIPDDGADRVGINTTATVGGATTWSFISLGAQSNGFEAEATVVDLNNDGWEDFIITDIDEDTYYGSDSSANRRTYIYHNNSGASFTTDNCGLNACTTTTCNSDLKYVHDVAALDINGDCWMDLVFFYGYIDTPGAEVGTTKVFINNAPGGSACPPPACPTDLTGGGCTNGIDLAMFLGAWTGTTSYRPCPPFAPADFNHDCKTNGLDLATLLGAWGPCSGGSCP